MFSNVNLKFLIACCRSVAFLAEGMLSQIYRKWPGDRLARQKQYILWRLIRRNRRYISRRAA